MNTRYPVSLWNNTANEQLANLPPRPVNTKQDKGDRLLEKYQVCDWMQTDVVTANPELRIERAWERMARHKVRHLPVIKDDILVGMVTERDLKRAIFGKMTSDSAFSDAVLPTSNPGDYPVAAIMTRRVVIAARSENLSTVAQRMMRERVGALPVISGSGKLLGILTLSDVVRAMLTNNDGFSTTEAKSLPVSIQKGESVWATQ